MASIQTRRARTVKEQPTIHEHRTAKVVEIVGSSRKSFDEAIRTAVADAAETTRGIRGAHIENMSVHCENGVVTEYRVDLKIAFGIERTPEP